MHFMPLSFTLSSLNNLSLVNSPSAFHRSEEMPEKTPSDALKGRGGPTQIMDDVVATDDTAAAPVGVSDHLRSLANIQQPRNGKVQAVGKQRRTDIALTGLVIFLVLLNLAWLSWVVALSTQPTVIINSIMNTKDFDYGTFWLMNEAPRAIVALGVAGLACVAIGYLFVIYKAVQMQMTNQRAPTRGCAPKPTSRSLSSVIMKRVESSGASQRTRTTSFQHVVSKVAVEITNRESRTRRNIAVGAKLADIAVQCLVIAQLLGDGIPPSLSRLFSAIVILNAVVSCVFCLLPYDNMGRAHILTDTALDFGIAVMFPFIQVVYAQQLFTFDRSLFEINQQIFPPGFFERTEITVADPTEVEAIRHVIDSVRIDSLLKVFTRVGTSASLLFRCIRLVALLRAHHKKAGNFPNEYPKKNRFLAALLAAVAVFVVVWTEESIRTSREACAMHPECVQYAHRWIVGREVDDPSHCPCITLIDRDLTIASYDDWVQPPNRTEKVAQLATSGRLQTLQLVNRGLEIIPEQLRRCTTLKHISLYYTNTQTLPEWFREFTELQFMHIEGKESGPNPQKSLHTLPDGLFDDMGSLLFLHFGLHRLRELPSFDGLFTLRSISLAILFELEALPSLAKLQSLERFLVYSIPTVQTFPDLDHLNKLRALVVGERGAFCCNGFLGADRCNLTHPLCTYHRLSGKPAVAQCLSATDKTASPATRAAFDMFKMSACDDHAVAPEQIDVPPARAAMDQCNGTMYRQCVIRGYGFGMCYNPRWMPVSCNSSPFAMEMRRRQIAQKLGKPCDPENEAWLGC